LIKHIFFWSLFYGMVLAAPAAKNAPDEAYRESWEKWKSGLIKSRKENWLTLAGLYWLKPGDNTFGSDPGNAIVFPKGPGHAGWFELNGKEVTLKLLPGVEASVADKPVSSVKLEPDTSENTTTVAMGSLRFYAIVRGKRVGIRLRDLENPQAKTYSGPVFYPINLRYRVTAKWFPSDGKKTVDVPNVLGDSEAVPVEGTADFMLDGKEMQLTAIDDGGDLFFVFNDPTKKTDTYPGGRFLKAERPGDGIIVLDFNRAYNPPCAVTPYATCPLAPRENRLAAPILAGEKFAHAPGRH
jgi:uncharacterized protein (DUF1684 family)